MKSYKAITEKIGLLLGVLSGASLVLCMCIVVWNAIIRNFTDPITATSELAGMLGMFGITFGLAYAQLEQSNVGITLLTDKLGVKVNGIINIFVLLVSTGFFALVGYKLVEYAVSLIENESFLQTSGYTIYPFVFTMALGFIGLLWVLIYQLVEALISLTNRGAVE